MRKDQAVIVIEGTTDSRVFIKVDTSDFFIIKNGASLLTTFNLQKCIYLGGWYQKMT